MLVNKIDAQNLVVQTEGREIKTVSKDYALKDGEGFVV